MTIVEGGMNNGEGKMPGFPSPILASLTVQLLSVFTVLFEAFVEFPTFGVQTTPTIPATADLTVVCSSAENCTEVIPVMVMFHNTSRGWLAL